MKTGNGYIVQDIDSCANCKHVGRIPWNSTLFCQIIVPGEPPKEEVYFNPQVEQNGICNLWELECK
jgi:hypothetical protein